MEEEKGKLSNSTNKGDRKPEGRVVQAQLGLSELDSKQEILMLNDG